MRGWRTVIGVLVVAALSAAACTNSGDDDSAAPSDSTEPSPATSSTAPPSTVATSTTEGQGPGDNPEPVSVEVLRADAIERVLVDYTEAINDRRPEDAYDLFTEELRSRVPVDELVDGTSTSFISRLSVAQVVFDGADGAAVIASFRSDQDPAFGRDGQPCSIWELEYQLVDVGGQPDEAGDWRIDQATPLEGTPIPCPVVTPDPDQDGDASSPSTTGSTTPGAKPIVHLTLDDGPGPETDRFLDLFERFGIEATFFPVTNRFPGREATVQRIVDDGHAIANHTHLHCNLQDPNNLTPARLCSGRTASDEIADAQRIIQQTLGFTPTCFRPPYGAQSAATREVIASFGLTNWLWDIDTNDWRFNANNSNYTDAQAIAELNKVATIRPSYGSSGVIVLLHDGTASAPRMLRLLEEWLVEHADDYEFRALDGC